MDEERKKELLEMLNRHKVRPHELEQILAEMTDNALDTAAMAQGSDLQ